MKAFEQLYERHNRRVYSVCLRMTHNVSEAEDLTQETFIQLFRKIGSFRGDSAFTTWLHRLTVNQVLMHFRKRSVKLERTTEEGETPEQIVIGSGHPDRMPVVDRTATRRWWLGLHEGQHLARHAYSERRTVASADRPMARRTRQGGELVPAVAAQPRWLLGCFGRRSRDRSPHLLGSAGAPRPRRC